MLYCSFASAVLILSLQVTAQVPKKVAKKSGVFGGPEQVDNRIMTDMELALNFRQIKFMRPYGNFKESLKNNAGFGYGVDYSAAFFNSGDDIGWTDASSGIFRVYFSWDLVKRNTANKGGIVFKIEHRHKFGEIPPSTLSARVGYAGGELPPNNDDRLRLTNFYWRQWFLDGRLTLFVGLLDATDYLDAYALTSPWTGFMNASFSTGSQVIYIPNDAALGFSANFYLSKNIYLAAGLVDACADPTQPWSSFETFFTKNNYFKSLEIGYVSEANRFLLDNIHLTYWHSNGSEIDDASPGWGISFSGSWYFTDKWLPFLKGGFAKDGETSFEKSLSTGVGYQQKPNGSVLGFALNWGRPNEETFNAKLRDQYTFEIFYRGQITSRIALTPDIQFIIQPAINADLSSIFLWGIRGRFTL